MEAQPTGGVPSFVGLSAREAVARSLEAGGVLALEMVGSGRVVGQDPQPGVPPGEDGRVRLTLAGP
ncbi:MAG: PASTA domain-containing protein [Deltaproteobacteria bacterium]|nr:PASTA domain-containing protein [Deltaproteobacteria bacterium]